MQRRILLLSAASALAALVGCGQEPASPAYPRANTPDERYLLASQGKGFVVGQALAANAVYVFFDPQCPHCATLWKNAQPLLGRVRMTWIPVGLLNAASSSQGAFILGSADPAAAMNEHEELLAQKRGGISVPLSGVDSKLKDIVSENTRIFNALGAESIPFIVYRNARTGQAGSQPGAMPTEALASLLGV